MTVSSKSKTNSVMRFDNMIGNLKNISKMITKQTGGRNMEGYKGFDCNMKCKDFQFETGKSYKAEKAELCNSVFHFCEHPLNVFSYYPPATSRFAKVLASGDILRAEDNSKVCCTEISIGDELSLNALISASIQFIFPHVKKSRLKRANQSKERSHASNTGYRSAASNTGYYSAASNTGNRSSASNTGNYSAASNTGYYSAASNTGNRSAASNTGYYSAASNTGDRSSASNTGYYSVARVEGKQSIACGLGIKNKAKGKLTCWLVLAEWHQVDNDWAIKEVKSVLVDGKIIKEDVWYMLKNGKFEEIL